MKTIVHIYDEQEHLICFDCNEKLFNLGIECSMLR